MSCRGGGWKSASASSACPISSTQNSVGTDTHFQFLNWSVDNNGAWDYAADTRGYTVGVMADYEDRNWGFRFAEALMPKVANGIDLVWRPWQVHAENWEYELRHGVIPKKSGVVRLLAYMNYANMGVYRDANLQFKEGLVAVPTSPTIPGTLPASMASASTWNRICRVTSRRMRAGDGTTDEPSPLPTPRLIRPSIRELE